RCLPAPSSVRLSVSSRSPHRQRHSFPTRRSSDLDDVAQSPRGDPFADAVSEVDVEVPPGLDHRLRSGCAADRAAEPTGSGSGNRPEEHATELQSREKLACRLLHETKTHAADCPTT